MKNRNMAAFRFLLLLIMAAAITYFYGCASSEEKEDKYPLVTKQDRKDIAKICGCLDPLLPYLDKVINAKDSLEAAMYSDSLEQMGEKIEPCLGNMDEFENKLNKRNEKYLNQFLEYVNEKHPMCALFFIGMKTNIIEEKNDGKEEIQK